MRIGLCSEARRPTYCTSGDKAMLAELDPAEVTALHVDGLDPWPGEDIHNGAAPRKSLGAASREH